MKYRIYRNLTKKCWSIQERTTKGWRVTKHLDSFAAEGCTFKVYEAGRQRVLEERKKNVHSYAICEKLLPALISTLDFFPLVSYNPYSNGYFTCQDKRIDRAQTLYFGTNGLYLIEESGETA